MVGHSMSGRYCPQKTTSSADMEHSLQAVDQGGPRDFKISTHYGHCSWLPTRTRG